MYNGRFWRWNPMPSENRLTAIPNQKAKFILGFEPVLLSLNAIALPLVPPLLPNKKRNCYRKFEKCCCLLPMALSYRNGDSIKDC